MKRMFVFAAAFCITIAAAAKPSTAPLSSAVLKGFVTEFGAAVDVKWSVKNELLVATFQLNNETVSAWFNEEGEMELMEKIISTAELVPAAFSAVQQLEEKAAVTAVTEVYQQNQLYYLVKTETATHTFTYKILTDGSVTKLDRKKK
jgi:hypothetical protein